MCSNLSSVLLRFKHSRYPSAFPNSLGDVPERSTLKNSIVFRLASFWVTSLSKSAVSWSVVNSVKDKFTFSIRAIAEANIVGLTVERFIPWRSISQRSDEMECSRMCWTFSKVNGSLEKSNLLTFLYFLISKNWLTSPFRNFNFLILEFLQSFGLEHNSLMSWDTKDMLQRSF